MTKNKSIILAGNPNVGKSSLFNALTGMKQHTGNWIGKTTKIAKGGIKHKDSIIEIFDIPGTYSLYGQSEDEIVARDFICFKEADKIVVVCDAMALERNLNLFFQVLECRKDVILCINLIDEAEKNGLYIDKDRLEKILNIPVLLVSARKKYNLDNLKENMCLEEIKDRKYRLTYDKHIESKISNIGELIGDIDIKNLDKRWLAIKLLENDTKFIRDIEEYIGYNLLKNIKIRDIIENENLEEEIIKTRAKVCKDMASLVVKNREEKNYKKTLKIDKIITSKKYGIPIMIMLLFLVFWITIVFANYPSQILSNTFLYLENILRDMLLDFGVKESIVSLSIDGVYKVVTWVIAVMLPPMAIFFPLFSILEDLGYLPRLAFNMDRIFKKCNSCGKQALTMCMGFGCNACAISGSKIIGSDKERLLAIITNNFMPCNGRFPTLIAIISMFFIASLPALLGGILSAGILAFIIGFGIFMTFLVCFIFSKFIGKEEKSNFILELPPYRKPEIRKTIIRSIFDKTIYILGRAILVSIPAGIVIWTMANISINGVSILNHFVYILNPLGEFMGLDGVILLAFILGSPANEIVLPIIIMTYLGTNTLIEIDNLNELKALFIQNGWTLKTAICTLIFCVFHWPCSTTSLTIKKETNSLKWTFISIALPTFIGFCLCVFINLAF